MKDYLVLTVVIRGQNIMRNPLLKANGLANVEDKRREIEIETPVTSIKDFIEAFEGLFKEE